MELSRKELYELVWAEPMTTICQRFGLSDNGLRKHCKSMNIPTPPVGYWSKLKHGIKTEKIPLPEEKESSKQNISLNETDNSQKEKIDLTPQLSKEKKREMDISSGDISSFKVPEVLYAKDPIIMDTKEKLRQDSDNNYLKRNPFGSKIKSALDITVSPRSIDRALNIFSTIIKALKFRGHSLKIKDSSTYIDIQGEEIQISMTEKKKQVPELNNPLSNYNLVFGGELNFNILYSWKKIIYKDTAHIKLEDKIIPIVAKLEIISEEIKEYRIEAEKQRIIREAKERKEREFEERRKAEKNEFKALFSMAERLHKTNILRQYISTYEEYLKERGELNEEAIAKLKWAKDKSDWFDPFVSKEDLYLDYYNKDKILEPECPKQDSYNYSTGSSYQYPFWLKNRY